MTQITGTQEWIDGARNAAKALRSIVKPAPDRTPAPNEFPVVPYNQTGLRPLDQTMSVEAEEGKGRFVNRYL